MQYPGRQSKVLLDKTIWQGHENTGKLISIAARLADLHYLDQAEELCCTVLLRHDGNDYFERVSETMVKVSKLRETYVYPDTYPE